MSCDIHTAMRATVYISSTPYIATADEQGRFTFENVVPGSYKLFGFEEGTRIEKIVEIAGARVDLSIP